MTTRADRLAPEPAATHVRAGGGSYVRRVFRGAPASLACVGWTRCTGSARVVECLYDGEHAPPPWRADMYWSFASGAWPPRGKLVPRRTRRLFKK